MMKFRNKIKKIKILALVIPFYICSNFFTIIYADNLNRTNNENFINLSDQNDFQKKIDKKNYSEKELNKKEKLNKQNNFKNQKISSVKIGKLKSPSLGSIGIETSINKEMGLNIWNQYTAQDVINNINYIPDIVSSNYLQNRLVDIYSSISISPQGSSEEIIKFVETKLLKIASSGNVEYLEKIVKQLPNSKRWNRWKKWSVEHHLIKNNDKEACKKVNENLNQNADVFWRKANIICLLINQKHDEANFINDVMVSQKLVDPLFNDLFKNILEKTNLEKLRFDDTKLEPLHIVMLDILKYKITAKMIAEFDPEYTVALIDLKYLNNKATSFLLDKLVSYREIKREKIIKIYQSVVVTNIDHDLALKNLNQNADGINRAQVWISAMNIKDELKKVEYILKIIDIEHNLGRLRQALDLYLPILEEIEQKSLPNNLNLIISNLKILNTPNKFLKEPLSKTLLLKKGEKWSLQLINFHQAWGLVPYLEDKGMLPPEHNWHGIIDRPLNNKALLKNEYKWTSNYDLKNLTIRKAILQKANNNEKIFTLLLISRLFNDKLLYNFDIRNLFVIETALNKIGLGKLGKKLRIEILTSKFASLKN